MKKRIRLTESDLHRIIRETVKRVLNESGGESLFKEEDERMNKMIERWRLDKSLKPLDPYFKWKSHEISTGDFKTLTKNDIMKMIKFCRELQHKNYDENAEDPKDWFKDKELAYLLEYVEMELINIYPLFKSY